MKDNRRFAAELVDLTLKNGAEQAEVYLKPFRSLTIEIRNQAVDAIESSSGFGYSLRVIRDGRLGFSYSTSVADKETVVRNAIESSKWSDRDEYLDLPGLPAHDERYRAKVDGLELFDREIEELKEEDAIKHVLAIEKAAKDFDNRIKKIRKASATFGRGEVLILNSKGIDVSYPYTKCTAQVMAVAEENEEGQMGWDFEGGRFLKDISFENVGRNAARRAVQLLGSRKINTAKVTVVLDNSVVSEFLGVLASSLSAESVQKGRSLLKDRIGQKVLSPKVSIIDSGIIPRKLGARPFDDEGVATSEKVLIRDGILQGFLYNTYSAKKAGVSSTGNALRGGYSGLPTIGITNLYLSPSSKAEIIPMDDLLSSLDKGIYITEAMGVHTANPISGEFSVGVSGLWIENGKIQFPIKEAVISGDILSFLGRIEALADDMRFYGNIGTPSLLIGPTDISA